MLKILYPIRPATRFLPGCPIAYPFEPLCLHLNISFLLFLFYISCISSHTTTLLPFILYAPFILQTNLVHVQINLPIQRQIKLCSKFADDKSYLYKNLYSLCTWFQLLSLGHKSLDQLIHL